LLGFQGTQGVQGRQGVQGVQGVQGLQGLQGLQGHQGLQGLQGPTAAQGTTGIQGTDGLQGTQGVQGIAGAVAAQGMQGTNGIQGTDGLQGTQGVQGLQGPTAAQGTTGIQGTDGLQGTQGVQGLQGPTASQGTQGIQGHFGFQGTQGVQGAQGLSGGQGLTGSQGTQGTQGVQGRQGLQGFQGTQGGQGLQGLQGLQGAQGRQGIQGLTGTQGFTGIQGTQGIQGIQGRQGLQGPTASQGTQGIQGLDGLFAAQGFQGVQGPAGAGGGGNISGPASATTNGVSYFTSLTEIASSARTVFNTDDDVLTFKANTVNGGTLRFFSTGNTRYTEFGRDASTGANYVLFLPDTGGSEGQVLTATGVGGGTTDLGWTTVASFFGNTVSNGIPYYNSDESKLSFSGAKLDDDNIMQVREIRAVESISGIDEPAVRISASGSNIYTSIKRLIGGSNVSIYLPTGSANTTYGGALYATSATSSVAELAWIYGIWGDAIRNDTSNTNYFYPTFVRDYFNNANNVVYVSDGKLAYQPSSGTFECVVLSETSSIRFKENLRPITSALPILNQFSTYIYDRKDGSASNVPGVIAEEVVNILPTIVSKDESNNVSGVNYTKIIPYLIEGIKELTIQVQSLQAEIDLLKNSSNANS
jgi:hypothetical protein